MAVVAVAAAVWYGHAAPEVVAPPLATSAGASATITVHVAGEVSSPGLVEVAAGARVADAVAAAGGSTRGADLAAVNLAAEVTDGEQIIIPAIAGDPATAAAGSLLADGRVRINTASAVELENLPGVGPVLASRIAAYRDDHGPFGAVEDLLDVPGIGEGKLATLRDSVALP